MVPRRVGVDLATARPPRKVVDAQVQWPHVAHLKEGPAARRVAAPAAARHARRVRRAGGLRVGVGGRGEGSVNKVEEEVERSLVDAEAQRLQLQPEPHLGRDRFHVKRDEGAAVARQ